MNKSRQQIALEKVKRILEITDQIRALQLELADIAEPKRKARKSNLSTSTVETDTEA